MEVILSAQLVMATFAQERDVLVVLAKLTLTKTTIAISRICKLGGDEERLFILWRFIYWPSYL